MLNKAFHIVSTDPGCAFQKTVSRLLVDLSDGSGGGIASKVAAI